MLSLNRALCRTASDGGSGDSERRRQVPSRCLLHWWRRLVLQLLVVSQAARFQEVLTGLDYMNDRKKKQLQDRLDAAPSDRKKEKGRPTTSRVTTPGAKGKILAPSRSATAKARLRPEDCPHAEDRVVPRGGHLLWFTCLDCGTRWERLEGDSSIQVATAPALPAEDHERVTATPPKCRCDLPMVIRCEPQDRTALFWGCANYGRTSGCRLVTKLRPGDLTTTEGRPVQEYSMVDVDDLEEVPQLTTTAAAVATYRALRNEGKSEAAAAAVVTRMATDQETAEEILAALAAA